MSKSGIRVFSPGRILPTVEGRVHGIVGLDPWRVQCDDCLRVWEGSPMVTLLLRSWWNVYVPGVRCCDDCWAVRGWRNDSMRGIYFDDTPGL